ncbi:unnamed protein product [Boreogadus saida]
MEAVIYVGAGVSRGNGVVFNPHAGTLTSGPARGVGAGLERSPVHSPQNSDLLLYRKVLWEPVPDWFPAAVQGSHSDDISPTVMTPVVTLTEAQFLVEPPS